MQMDAVTEKARRSLAETDKPRKIAPGHNLYALCARDHAYYLVGPFRNYAALTKWGNCEHYDLGDDPRWQSIELPIGQTMPELRGPDWHPGYTP